MEFWEIDSNTVAIKFFGEIGSWYQDANNFTRIFNGLERQYANIIIKVHCYGGSVFEGNVIYNALNQSKCNITYEIVGVSASMSSILQTGCNKVTIAENGFVMVHRPSAGSNGNADDLFSMGKLLKAMEQNFIKNYTSKTGKKPADIAKLLDGADHWFDANEALAYGLVDEIIPAQVKSLAGLHKPLTDQEAQTIYDQFSASLTTGIPAALTTQQINNHTQMKELIIAMFGLANLTKDSSDTAVAEALKARFAENTTSIATLQAKLEGLEKSQVETLVAAAETSNGKPFTKEVKENLTAIGKESVAALRMAIGFISAAAATTAEATTEIAAAQAGADKGTATAAPSALNLLTGKAADAGVIAERKDWTWEQWCQKDEKGLLALSAELQAGIYKASYGVEMPK